MQHTAGRCLLNSFRSKSTGSSKTHRFKELSVFLRTTSRRHMKN